MEWKYNDMRQVHELKSAGATVARIFLSEKPRNRRPYRAKTLVSALYFSQRTMNRLDKRKKEWVTGMKKFLTKDSREEYLRRKKAAVERFITARERELAGS